MATTKIEFEIPDDLRAMLGSLEELSAQAKQAFVLGLLRNGRIGQSRAAELLGISRAELLDLMVQFAIPSALRTPEDVDRETEAARRITPPRRA